MTYNYSKLHGLQCFNWWYESYGLRDAASGALHGFIRKNPGEMCEHHGKPIRQPACSSMKPMFVGRFYLADLAGVEHETGENRVYHGQTLAKISLKKPRWLWLWECISEGSNDKCEECSIPWGKRWSNRTITTGRDMAWQTVTRLGGKISMSRPSTGEQVSLCAKWCPWLNHSFDRRTLICESIARWLFPPSEFPESWQPWTVIWV
jgi:hypothetical protein